MYRVKSFVDNDSKDIKSININNIEYDMDNILKLIGMYISDGSIDNNIVNISCLKDNKINFNIVTVYFQYKHNSPELIFSMHKNKLTIKEFAGAKHLMVTTTGKALGFIDYLLDLKGLKRRVAMTVNQFLVAPSIIRKSNMILTCSKRVAERFKLENVKILPIPLITETLKLKIIFLKLFFFLF